MNKKARKYALRKMDMTYGDMYQLIAHRVYVYPQEDLLRAVRYIYDHRNVAQDVEYKSQMFLVSLYDEICDAIRDDDGVGNMLVIAVALDIMAILRMKYLRHFNYYVNNIKKK